MGLEDQAMNDAPTIAEKPALDAKAIAELARQLTELLRIRTFPFGMKLFDDAFTNSIK